MTLLLQIRGYRAAGHLQLSDTNKQHLPLLTSLRLDSSLRPSDLGLLLLQAGVQLAQELGFDRGESLLANSSFTALVGLAAMAFGAFDMILLPPPCCSCLPSAETSHADLSPAVSQPGSAFGGKKKKSEWEGGCEAPARGMPPTFSLMLWLEIVLQVLLVRGMGWRKANRPYLSWGKEHCN